MSCQRMPSIGSVCTINHSLVAPCDGSQSRIVQPHLAICKPCWYELARIAGRPVFQSIEDAFLWRRKDRPPLFTPASVTTWTLGSRQTRDSVYGQIVVPPTVTDLFTAFCRLQPFPRLTICKTCSVAERHCFSATTQSS